MSISKRPRPHRRSPSSKSVDKSVSKQQQLQPRDDSSHCGINLPLDSGIITSPLVSRSTKSIVVRGETKRIPLPDQKLTIEEKLTACLEALKTSYQASAPIVDDIQMPNFAGNLVQVEKFVRGTLESEGSNAGVEGESASIYVCGGPGIGTQSNAGKDENRTDVI